MYLAIIPSSFFQPRPYARPSVSPGEITEMAALILSGDAAILGTIGRIGRSRASMSTTTRRLPRCSEFPRSSKEQCAIVDQL
jgi:hypothetical protein